MRDASQVLEEMLQPGQLGHQEEQGTALIANDRPGRAASGRKRP